MTHKTYMTYMTNFFKTKKRKLIFSLFLVLIIILPTYFIFFHDKAGASWWNEDWHYRKSIQVTNNTTAESNVYVSITLDTSDTSKFQTDCGDIRFTKNNGEVLPYYISSGCGTASTIIYVSLDSFPAGSQTLYYYYGNPTAENGFSVAEGSGSVTQANMRLSILNGTSFVDFSEANKLTPHLNKKLIITDSTGKKLIGYIKNAGTGETYGSELIVDGGMENWSSTTNLVNWTEAIGGVSSVNRESSIFHSGVYSARLNVDLSSTYVDIHQSPSYQAGHLLKLNYWGYSAELGKRLVIDFGGHSGTLSDPGPSWQNYTQYHSSRTITGLYAKRQDANSIIYYDDLSLVQVLTPSATGTTITSTSGGSTYNWKSEESTFDRNSSSGYTYTIFPLAFSTEASNYTIGALGTEEKSLAPVGYWTFDEGQGTVAHDESSNKNDGIITGATWKDESGCVSGKCLGFDGGGDYISTPIGNNINVSTDPISVSMWVKPSTSKNEIFFSTANGTNQRLYISIYGDKWDMGIQSNTQGGSPSSSVTYNQWHHIYLVMDGTVAKLYINGQFSFQKNYTPYTVASNFYIGKHIADSGFDFLGSIDEPKIYPYARTANQIKQDYNAGLAGQSASKGSSVALGSKSDKWLSDGLVGHWKMDEASGTTVVDSSGNNNVGTLTNAQETGTSDASGNTVNTIIDTDGALSTTDDVYNGMIFRFTVACGSISAGTERLISDYNGATKTFSTVLALASIPNSCPYEIGHQVGGKFGNGVRFDGINDYVSVPDSESFNFGTKPITISSWVKFNSDSLGAYRSIVSQSLDSFELNKDSGNRLRLEIKYAGDVVLRGNETTPSLTVANRWYFVTATFNPIDGTMEFYVDGDKKGTSYSDTRTGGNLKNSTTNINIGARSSSEILMSGSLDELRIYNRKLSSDEIQSLYKYAPGPVLHLKMDEKSGTTAYDSSGNNNNGNLNNGPIWESGKNNGALLLDGNNDTVSGSLTNTASKTAVTLEAWVWIKSLDQRPSVLCSSPSAYCLFVVRTGNLQMYLRTDQGWSAVQTTDSYSWTDGWHHIVSTYDAEEQKVKLYRDGRLVSTGTKTGIIYSNVTNFVLGTENSNYFNGLIDDVKIYNYARTQEQILEDMVGQGGPTLSSNAALKKPILDLSFDEGRGLNVYDRSDNKNNGTLVSGATGANTTATAMWDKGGKEGGAMEFDGDDYVDLGNNSSLQVKDNFSVSFWVKRNGAWGKIMAKWDSGNSKGWAVGFNNQQISIGFRKATTDYWSAFGSTLVPDKTWAHVTFVYKGDGSQPKLWVNGIDQTLTVSLNVGNALTGITDSGENLSIGRSHAFYTDFSYFSGSIDELKIYNYALEENEIRALYNDSASMAMGNDESRNNNGATVTGDNKDYCIPGDTAKCDKPVLELKMDEKSGTTAYDTSGNGFNGTLNGGPIWDRGKFGGGLSLGTGNYVTVADNAQLRPGTGDFTASVWIKTPFSALGIDNSWPNIFLKGMETSAPAHTWGFMGLSTSKNQIRFAQSSETSGIWDVMLSSGILSNGWHFAVARRIGTTTQLYIDGKFYAEDTSAGSDLSSSANIYIGGNTANGSSLLGNVDQVSYYNYARTPAQIAWDYNRGKPVGHWKLDENEGLVAHDESGNNNHGTLTNMDSADWVAGKNNKALDFDGTNDYVDVGSNVKYTNGVTYSAWIKPDIIQNNDHIIRKFSDTLRLKADGRLEFTIDGASWNEHLSARSVSVGVWTHVTATFDDNSDTLRYYINGEMDSELNYLASIATGGPGTYPMFIGENSYLSNQGVSLFDGQIDDVKIFNYALTAEQVKLDYNSGAVNFK